MHHTTVRDLFERMASRGTGAYGLSDVNQVEHAIQSAALASGLGLSDEMIIAALFHDIGHLFSEEDVDLASLGVDDHHEDSSADVLLPLFGPMVSEPVRLHVAAKRYLCSVENDYFSKLSTDSRVSLELQGGLMLTDEVRAFEEKPFWQEGVQLRRIDDQAKVPGLDVPELMSYLAMAEALSSRNRV